MAPGRGEKAPPSVRVFANDRGAFRVSSRADLVVEILVSARARSRHFERDVWELWEVLCSSVVGAVNVMCRCKVG